MIKTLRNPSGWVPLALTVCILAVFLFAVASAGLTPQKDEGTAAHLFQIWAVVEFCAIAFFAFKYIPRNSRQALQVLGLQIIFALIPFLIVFLLHL
jgi:TRAP-type C4-dicarboxylate transport system permease small subunit